MIKYISTSVGGLVLRGTAHIPDKGKQRYPTVLMFHGFASTRNEVFNSFVEMSRVLNMDGIAAVRFDFGCHGESDGDFSNFIFTQELQEGAALVEFAKTLDFVEPYNLSLLGMSLGSVAASMTAGKYPNAIKSLCMWSPATVFVDEIVNKHILQGRTTDEVQQVGYFDFNSLKLGPKFFEDVKHIHPYQVAVPFTGPVIIINGDADNIAPIKYAKRYLDFYQQDIKLVVVSGASHAWNTVSVKEALIRETRQFFKETLMDNDVKKL